MPEVDHIDAQSKIGRGSPLRGPGRVLARPGSPNRIAARGEGPGGEHPGQRSDAKAHGITLGWPSIAAPTRAAQQLLLEFDPIGCVAPGSRGRWSGGSGSSTSPSTCTARRFGSPGWLPSSEPMSSRKRPTLSGRYGRARQRLSTTECIGAEGAGLHDRQPDAQGSDLLGQGFGEPLDGMLGRRVVREPCCRAHPGDRGDSDDEPFRARRSRGSTARVTSMRPKTFVSNCCLIWSSAASSTPPRSVYPALLTSTSIPPKARRAWSTAHADSSGRVTSATAASAFPLLASVIERTASADRTTATTLSPRATAASTMARPIPRDAPVTNQTRLPFVIVIYLVSDGVRTTGRRRDDAPRGPVGAVRRGLSGRAWKSGWNISTPNGPSNPVSRRNGSGR